jgi:hypothetical protein
VRVRGTVRFGDEPIAANLWFGTRYGREAVQIDTDSNGRFEGLLPRDGSWAVTVEALDGELRRQLGQVEVEADKDVEIVLPATTLSGRVVDRSKLAVKGAQVSAMVAQTMELPVTVSSGADGRFEIKALAEGQATVWAETARLRSRVHHVELNEELTTREVVLVLEDLGVWKGIILGPSGGIAGASVMVSPVSDGFSSYSALTDVTGRFEVELPDGTDVVNAVVMPPGFALRAFRQPVIAGEETVIPVSSIAGDLLLELPAPANSGDPPRSLLPFLAHDGALVGLMHAIRWAAMNGVPSSPGETTLRIPSVEAGEWQYCLVDTSQLAALASGSVTQPDACVTEFLSPGGMVTLAVAEPP